MIPLNLKNLAEATDGKLIGDNKIISDISTDSRKVQAGTLFIPVKGDNFDGHDFIESALSNGAVSFISHKEVGFESYILVKDTRKALLDIACYYKGLFDIPVVAVTGSAGKTTVKNGIASVLSQKYNVLKTSGNFNNEIGLPLTVFKLDKSIEAAVLELGMNSFGEISVLSKAVRPYAGVITNIGTAHIENLKSREGIQKAKLELLDGMDENAVLILNHDDDMLRRLDGRLKQKIIWFSVNEKIGVHVEGAFDNHVIIRYNNRSVNVFMEIQAAPLISNILAAAAVGFLFCLSDNEIKLGIEAMEAEKGRLSINKNERGMTIIDDSYNANPESMRLAIDILSDNRSDGEHTIAILGDMLEQGSYALKFHREIGDYAATKGIDMLIAIGRDALHYKSAFDLKKSANQQSYHFDNKQDFINRQFIFSDNQVILVKASRGMRLDEIALYLSNIK